MANSFPLVRGRTMRVTKLAGCCQPAYGPDNMVVTDGFVSVALTANINEPEEIVVTNANGKTCVRDAGCPEFQGYGVEITFCEVTPCLFSLITGQPSVVDADGNTVGFKMNSGISLCDEGFALEVWMGVPGVACTAEAGGYGYLLLPCLSGGVVGDFTIENAAITFTISGAATKDGNGWGLGPHADTQLLEELDVDDHLLVMFSETAPPDSTDGCAELVPAVGGVDDIVVAITLGLTGTGSTGQPAAVVGGGPDGGVRIVPERPAGTPMLLTEIATVDWGDGNVDSPPNTEGSFVAHVYDFPTSPGEQYFIQVTAFDGGQGGSAPFEVVP